jgi:hypothetical protein
MQNIEEITSVKNLNLDITRSIMLGITRLTVATTRKQEFEMLLWQMAHKELPVASDAQLSPD